MCAIAGIIALDVNNKTVFSMLDTMYRRGPDGEGIFHEDNVTLLHRRLAIVDPDNGKQPMQLDWAGEQYTVVYNGELYNTSELRQELQKLGHIFQTRSDTEVVLHAYSQWNASCLDKLNGIFAFSVWESKRKRLFLARDRIGVKPLFFMLHNKGLVFASEIKTILKYPTIKAQLDTQGVLQLIMFGPGRMAGSGVFHNIKEIEPGCYGYYSSNKLHIHRYWKLTDREHKDSFQNTLETVKYLVTDSIKRQMVSDVPIGTFLSGGLDSSIISAVCAEEMKRRGEVLNTFSVDYLNNDQFFTSSKFQPESDTTYIKLMSETLHANHHWTVLTPDDLNAVLEEATIARDLPGMADVDFSLLTFSKQIRNHVKVALSGECADEIFGGYPWYRDPAIRAAEGFPWAQNTNLRASLLSDTIIRNENPADYVMDAYRTTCTESDILPDCTEEDRRIKEMTNLNFKWFMQTLLDRKDRMSMYHSLEVRVPFCDHRIAEYLYCVPWKYKNYQNIEKGLLRKAMEGILPGKVLYRKKSPYPKTYDPDYEYLIQSRLEVLIHRSDAPVWDILHKDAVVNMLHGENEWPWYGQLMRRPQTMAYLLQLNFWLEHYSIELLF